MSKTRQRRPATYYLRRLLELARAEWAWLTLATLFLVLSSSATLMYPQAIGAIMDQATQANDPGIIDRAALAMGGIFIFLGATEAIRYYL
ncbi:MAG: ABC transporter permease, partial [Myxococcota bacterium]